MYLRKICLMKLTKTFQIEIKLIQTVHCCVTRVYEHFLNIYIRLDPTDRL